MQRIALTAGTEVDRNGRVLEPLTYARALHDIRAYLAGRFGGYTETVTFGGWINGSGELVTESGHRWIVVTDLSPAAARVAAEEAAARVADLLRQESVLLELDSPAVDFVRAPERIETAAA